MKRLISILLLLLIFTLGCEGKSEYFATPKEAYLATIKNQKFVLTDALERTIKLDDNTILWIATVDSLTSGACILSAVCEVKNGKYAIKDTYESDVSYMKLSNLPLSVYSESRWEHTASNTHDHMWQWVATENSYKTQIKGAVAYDFSFEYAKTSYEVTLFTYSIEKTAD